MDRPVKRVLEAAFEGNGSVEVDARQLVHRVAEEYPRLGPLSGSWKLIPKGSVTSNSALDN